MATGSYEGYLLMEGILGHHEASRSRATLTGGLGVLPHPATHGPSPKAGDHGQHAAPAKAGEARG